ncbi:MAG: winged helix-turn-helix transcriptional regulator [Candidatus Nitrosocosmicus sp.]
MPQQAKKNNMSNGVEREEQSIIEKEYKIILDKTNLKIIRELVENPNVKSSEISEKLQIPLSTIQRRRATLEKISVLKKEYTIDFNSLGLRIAEILVDLENKDYEKVVESIKEKYSKHIISLSRKIGEPSINLGFKVIYSDSSQLFDILEELRKNTFIKKFEWYESIREEKVNEIRFLELLNK